MNRKAIQKVNTKHNYGKVLALLLMATSLLSAQSPPRDPKRIALEEKGAKLDVNNRQTAEELFDATFAVYHEVTIPPTALAAIKPAVVDAELAYWKNQKQGITDKAVVAAFNHAVDVLKLPEEAKTSENQLRLIHVGSIMQSPKFMGRGLRSYDDSDQLQLAHDMSPLQTLHVVLGLIDTKLNNFPALSGKDFLVTPAQWDAAHTGVPAKKPSGHRVQRGGFELPPETLQMQRAFKRSLANLSDVDGLLLLKDTLSTAGVM